MNSKISRLMAMTLGLLALSILTGCGAKLMMPAKTVDEVGSDKALITFFRAKAFGGSSQFIIWDSEEFVGTLIGGQYIQREMDPGEHMIIVHAQNWAYIKATLEAGKRYYMVINTAPGFTHAIAVPVPITKDQSKYGQADIDNWLVNLQPVTPDPEGSKEWVEKRKPQVQRAVETGNRPDTVFQYLNASDNWN